MYLFPLLLLVPTSSSNQTCVFFFSFYFLTLKLLMFLSVLNLKVHSLNCEYLQTVQCITFNQASSSGEKKQQKTFSFFTFWSMKFQNNACVEFIVGCCNVVLPGQWQKTFSITQYQQTYIRIYSKRINLLQINKQTNKGRCFLFLFYLFFEKRMRQKKPNKTKRI